jgi:parvulin-like peptidyl-prolyl isomerase
MRRLRRVTWAFVLVGTVLALAGRGEEALLDGVAAHVNSHVITVSDVMAAGQGVFLGLRQRYSGRELREQMRKAFKVALEALVDRRLILDSFEKEGGAIPGWIVEQRVEEIVRDKFGGDRLKLMEMLSGDGLSYDKWREDVMSHFIVGSLRHSQVTDKVKVSPVQVRREYNTNVDLYMSAPQVKLWMIVLREGRSEVGADAVKKRLDDGEAFAEVAKAVSVDRKAKDGGDWGWLPLSDLRLELSEAIAAAERADAACHVLKVPGEKDTYVFKVDGWKDGARIPFEEIQPAIEKKLRRAEEQRLYDVWIAGLKKNAYVKVFDVNVL